MDFFRRVFNKSESNPELTPPSAASGSDSLFGGLEVNEIDHASEERGTVSGHETAETTGESAFTSEFSFITEESTQGLSGGAVGNSSADASPSPSVGAESSSPPSVSISNPSPLTSSSNKPPTTKGGSKKSPKQSKPASSSSEGDSPPLKTPKKRVKKRLLENRPGYAATDQEPKAESGAETTSQNSTPSHTSTSPANHASSTATSMTSPPESNDTPSKEDVNVKESPVVAEHPGPLSQADALKYLQLEFDNQVMVYREMVKSLGERVIGAYHTNSELFLRLAGLEREQSRIREMVKEAEVEERYEQAEELNAKIDANEVMIQEESKRLVSVEAELDALAAQKLGVLSQFHSFQKLYVEKVSNLKSLQGELLSHYALEIADLESTASSVYAAKIDLLEERLTDVQGELSRVVEREQKVESKIASGAQGLVAALQEDERVSISLEAEIASLRAQLAQKEAELASVQSRRKVNQAKMDSLRKEQGGYLDDIVAEKQRKTELVDTLRLEKAQLDSQLMKQHEMIDAKSEIRSLEAEVLNSIEEVGSEALRMAEATATSLDTFKQPLLPVAANSQDDTLLDSIRVELRQQKDAVEQAEEDIVATAGKLKQARTEQDSLRTSLPLMEQIKQTAVSSRDYKEAARLKTEMSAAQVRIDALDLESTELTVQLQNARTALVEKNSTMASLISSMRQLEAKNAAIRMESLANQRKSIMRVVHSFASLPTPNDSALHQPMISLSVNQLNGMMEVIESEQEFLSIKYDVPIPVVEEELSLPSAVNPPELKIVDISTGTEAETTASADRETPDDEDGLFDGLDESVPEDLTVNQAEDAPENDPQENPRESDPANGDVEAQRLALEAQLQDLEAARIVAESDEDYEKAEQIHSECVQVQDQLDSLRTKT